MARHFRCPRCGALHEGTYYSTGAPSTVCDRCNAPPDRDVPPGTKPKRNHRKGRRNARKKVTK